MRTKRAPKKQRQRFVAKAIQFLLDAGAQHDGGEVYPLTLQTKAGRLEFQRLGCGFGHSGTWFSASEGHGGINPAIISGRTILYHARRKVAMKSIIMQEIGEAVEILYNLDIKLSNHFVGQPDHPNDQGVAGVRKVIRHALDALSVTNWISFTEAIDKGPDWKGLEGLTVESCNPAGEGDVLLG
jgi:hypothetical protein